MNKHESSGYSKNQECLTNEGIKRHASADDILSKAASQFDYLEASLPKTTEIVVTEANGDSREAIKEKTMNGLLKEECGTAPVTAAEPSELEAAAAGDKAAEELGKKIDGKKDEEKHEDKAADGAKEDKGFKHEGKKIEVSEEDFKHAEDLIAKVLGNEEKEAGEGEDESEDIKNLKEAVKLLGMKAPEAKEDLPKSVELPVAKEPAKAGIPFEEKPAVKEEVEAVEEEEAFNPFAALVAKLETKASVSDSVWSIKNAKDNSDYLSFSIKAAFGAGIDKDSVRSKYATSADFGRDVIAALVNEKVASATGAKAAVFGVVAHYSPAWPSVSEFPDQAAANPGKAGATIPVETDAKLPVTEKKKAAQDAELSVKAAEEAGGANGKINSDSQLFPTPKISEKLNTKTDCSATPHSTEQIAIETDRKLVASYEEQLRKMASENNALKLEAAIKDKTAKVRETINLLVRAGMIKPDEQTRIAALKDGLSIEAANAKAMASSIDTQSKNLFGMNTPQLDSYMHSLAALAPRAKTVTASNSASALTLRAEAMESEEDRLAHILGWE